VDELDVRLRYAHLVMSIPKTLTYMRSPASLCGRIIGSIIAPLTASIAFGIFFLAICFIEDQSERWWFLPMVIVGFATVFSFVTWIVVVLPLYLFISLRSVLWSWPICTACGSLSCVAIVALWSNPNASDRVFFLTIAAIIGGATCLTASLTRRRFQYYRNAEAGSSNGG
jgi:hypothetical protein